jgi:superfamily II DNA or RNA helicase
MRLVVTGQCELSDAPTALLEELRRELTVDNPKYKAAKRYSRWVGKKLQPKLYFFGESKELFCFPRGYGNQALRLCDQVLGERPEVIDRRRKLQELDLSFQGELRPYQKDAVGAVLARSFGVLEAATGSGKTVMALAVIAARRQPTLILVHSRELLHQWRSKINEFIGIEAGQIGDGRCDPRPVSVAIVNSARKRLEELVPLFGQLVVDECHRVPASLFTDVVSGFDSYFMLGLSATAFRREDGMTKVIYVYMGDPLYQVDARLLSESGAVVRPQYEQRPTGFRYTFRGDYAKLLKALTKNRQRNRLIVDDLAALLLKGHSGTVLVVSDRVAHCEMIRDLLTAEGLQSELLTGQVTTESRSAVVTAVQEGSVQVLIATVQLIGEGFDCAGLTTLVLATPIKFEGRLLQVVGRIMRPAEGKNAKVIDYVDTGIPVLARSAAIRQQVFDRWE